jgi:hypothetical protein
MDDAITDRIAAWVDSSVASREAAAEQAAS